MIGTAECRAQSQAQPISPTDLFGKALIELGLVGLLRGLSHPLIEPLGVVADQNAPALGLDAFENDLCRRGGRRRRLFAEASGAIERDVLNVLIRHRRGVDAHALQRCRVERTSLSLRRSESVPLWILRELETIEVPIWPGITTEHLMCGALSRRSLISASVKPFTANLAAL